MLLRETLAPLGVGLFALLQLLVAGQLLQLNEVVFGAAVALSDLGRVTLALAPHFMVFAIPLAYMLGVQLALGRLAGDHEILALAAAGRSPLALYRAPLALACALGLCAAGLARWAEPWGLVELHAVLNDVIKRNLGAVQPGVFIYEQLPRFTVYVSSVGPGESGAAAWHGVLVEDDVGDGSPLLALAQEGSIGNAGGEALAVTLRHGELHRLECNRQNKADTSPCTVPEMSGVTVARFGEAKLLVGVQERLTQRNRFYGNEASLSSTELLDEAAALDARAAARAAEGERLAAAGHEGEAGRAREDARGLSLSARRLRVVRARRWAVPVSCLAFALVGVPLAVIGGGVRAAAYLITLVAFVSFYVLGRAADALVESHALSPWLAAFLPHLVVAALGAALTARLAQRGVGKPR